MPATLITGPRRSLAALAVCAAASLLVACDDDQPSEADLPPAAELTYPGAEEVAREFDDAEGGTFVDGGSASRAARLTVTYAVPAVARADLFDWYETELVELDWTIVRRRGEVLLADRDPEGASRFGYSVTAVDDTVTTYVVRVTVAS